MVLYPYQTEGTAWLKKRKFALLADEMGLGKSVQAIMAAPEAGPILVVCPAIARTHWEQEWEKWSGRRARVVLSATHDRPTRDLVICSYAAIQNTEFRLWLLQERWALLIVDECHYAKEVTARRTSLIYGKRGLAHHADRVWCLSGTPAPNHAGELWPLLYTFGATPLHWMSYATRYCRMIQGGEIIGSRSDRMPELRQILDTVMLRRKKRDVLLDLPPITFHEVFVEPGDANVAGFWREEAAVMKGGARALESEFAKGQEALGVGMREAGEANLEGYLGSVGGSDYVANVRKYTALQKVEPICEMLLAEIDAKLYKQIIVFGFHRDPLRWLAESLRHLGVAAELIQGDTPPAKRDAVVRRFQGGVTQVLVANIIAAGTAINLTAAHNVLFLEQDWVPANNAQAAMRCHRHGQDQPVFVRIATIRDSTDERVQRVLLRKSRELAQLFD